MHKGRINKTAGTTAFGTRAPDEFLADFDGTRKRFRPDLETRQDAVLEAIAEWIERQRAPKSVAA